MKEHPIPQSTCPKCGQREDDHDGLGCLYCEYCGYCTHPSQSATPSGEMRCELCKRVVAP